MEDESPDLALQPPRRSAPANEADIRVGRRLKALRLEAQMSLTDLAGLAGMSIGALSQIERGVSSLRVRTIWPLAAALGIDASQLLAEGAEVNDIYCVRAQNRRELPVRSEGIRKQLLSPPGAALTGMTVEIEPNGGTAEAYAHSGNEFGYVLQGNVHLEIDASTYQLRAGDSFAFRSTLPHAFRNDGAERCIILWVNTTKPAGIKDDE